jgi:plasmid stability protein
MKRNTTLNLPADLIARTRAYAAAHGTTMTKIIQSHLEAITAPVIGENQSVLELYAAGQVTEREACRELGLRDGADLLLALAEAGLDMPLPPNHIVEEQAEDFARLWKDIA